MYYGDLTLAADYHSDRGNSAWAGYSTEQQEEALTRASDYIDRFYVEKLQSGRWSSLWCGSRVSISQERAWPRDDVTFYGEEVGDNVTPTAIEHATYEAALREAANPGSLLPDYTPTDDGGPVVQETVGPLTVKYADITKQLDMCGGCRPPNLPIIPEIDGIVAGYICRRYDFPGVSVV